MKKYLLIGAGAVVLLGLVVWGYTNSQAPESLLQTNGGAVNTQTVSGTVSRFYEGENKVAYSFQIPESATTTVEMDGALIRIWENGVAYANIYLSYEGGRGYGPIDYMGDIIAPSVPVINATGASVVGGYSWQTASSDGTEWHLAPVLNDQWLVVVEGKKSARDATKVSLESFKAE
jgi:hypothetical protein